MEEFWRQFNIKIAIVIRFPLYAFSTNAAIRKNATLVYKQSHLCCHKIKCPIRYKIITLNSIIQQLLVNWYFL
jgi:hypothetical protein